MTREEWMSAKLEGEALRAESARFSRMGWALLFYLAVSMASQIAAVGLAAVLAPKLLRNTVFLWGSAAFASYGVGVPAFYLLIRNLPRAQPGERRPLGPLRLGQCYLVCVAALYLGNLASLGINALIGLAKGGRVENPVESMLEMPTGLVLALVCVLAPIFEELMFRKILMDRLRPCGEWFALFASALAFSMFHGNLSQMIYAFAVGVVLGWVTLYTGRMWPCMLLHAGINFISAGLVPLLELLGEAGEVILSVFALGGTFLGMVFFLAYRRDIRLSRGPSPYSEGRKWRLLFENPGMVCFCLITLIEMVAAALA